MAYELPIASNLTLGGVKIGAGLTIDTDGKINKKLVTGKGAIDLPITSIEDEIIYFTEISYKEYVERVSEIEEASFEIEDTITRSLENIIAGKTLIANAITEKGVNTNFDDTFEQMAYNIRNISSGDISFVSKFEAPEYDLTALDFELQIQTCEKVE